MEEVEFGSDDEDNYDDENDTTSSRLRDETANGVLSFHNGTENSLLLFVKQAVKNHLSYPSSEEVHQVVLRSIDQFCFERHWMMHVGPEKGIILKDFLIEQLLQPRLQNRSDPYNIVELGTYCGYSTIQLAGTLLKYSDIVPNFHVYTIDNNAHSQHIAKQMLALAGLEMYVTFILRPQVDARLHQTKSFIELLVESMEQQSIHRERKRVLQIDFIFVDHAKEMYLPDVQQLESSGFIREGTAVAADNVIFFQLSEYCQYMSTLQQKGVVRTKLITDGLYLEYSATADLELRDGLELTVYVKDPIIETK